MGPAPQPAQAKAAPVEKVREAANTAEEIILLVFIITYPWR
ncbi:MAG: hypothetical protein ACLRRK_12745 [Parasutterella sp.]